MTQPTMGQPTRTTTAIRPFPIAIPDATLVDLRRRIATTRWPERETVTDLSQGVPLARLRELVGYWGADYDWRRAEAQLNALPGFITEIDGLDIHFLHIRSRHPNALPLIMTHGWPGSIVEFLKVIGPLTDPTSFGGRAEDAFDLVLPSLPGFGFSGKPQTKGWGPERIARAWAELMGRLGYTRYAAQGGDWGAVVTNRLGEQAPAGLLGIHVNLPAAPADIVNALNSTGDQVPAGLSAEEQTVFEHMVAFRNQGAGYFAIQATRPQTIGYGLADSPAGLAAWIYEKFLLGTDSGGEPERVLTRDEMLDDITLYWLTDSGASAARLYWEHGVHVFTTADVSVPAAVSVFPADIYRAPRSWCGRVYHELIYWHAVDKGGHFAAWEQPKLFSEEVRAAFRTLRDRAVQ